MKRDMVGYGRATPQTKWPNDAQVVINFVNNYEEGAEKTPVNGDETAETYGADFPFSQNPHGMRHLSMESMFEFGARVGFWRLVDLFDKNQIPLTFFATGYALTLNHEVGAYLKSSAHEVAGHGWRWINYASLPADEEKQHILKTIHTIKKYTGYDIKGWYTGRKSSHTRSLLIETGQFLYDSDSYADDLPYYEDRHLILPYSLDCNDIRYTTCPGFQTPEAFLSYLKDTFNFLYQEKKGAIMTIGLHPRISGHAAKTLAIEQFIKYIHAIPKVWIARRIDIATHWQKHFIVK